MKKAEFKNIIGEYPLYLDGATGSALIKRGMPAGVCPEEWILSNKEILISLQEEYLDAGSDIVYAPTFTSNRIKLKEYGLESEMEKINLELVSLSKEAVRRYNKRNPEHKVYVAGDLTMTGVQLKPMGNMDFEELIDIYKEQIRYLVKAEVDLLVIETMMSLGECRAALIAAKETCDLPVLVSMTFEEDGRSLYGTDAKTALVTLQHLGADAFGANCSSGPDKMIKLMEEMSEIAQIPLICKPNAGIPSLSPEGITVYDMAPAEFAREMADAVGAGARILGGCCGTTPQHIDALVRATREIKCAATKRTSKRFLTSERKLFSFDLQDNFIIVGERINPTGKKTLQEELRNHSFDLIREYAEKQEEDGASILDVNVGMSGIDEKETMLRALDEISETVSLPLAIDSSNVEVMEAALRRYHGRALINSISLEKVKYDNLLPIAKKYGAMFVLLPLSDEGLPKSLEDKKKIIHTILNRALELGMSKDDIVVDGLVTTVGANKAAALETLETIRYCKELDLATLCGLSNISFGLPERICINMAFLTMAIQSGLTMAIANPSQQLLVSSALASDLLQNKEGSDIRYIEYINSRESLVPNQTVKKVPKDEKTESQPQLDERLKTIYQAVLKGNKNNILNLTKERILEGVSAPDILNIGLLPAINEVGELFDKGIYFLPQLIASAETMKIAIEHIEPMLMLENDGKEMPVIVIATVAGDIHDIGKNLVALMLKNYGFRVIDLGKDVPREKIVAAAKEHGASIIALSALMTTTMKEMKQVIDYAKDSGCTCKFMIGGAVITQEYADEIGADGYSKDAAEAVRLAKRLLELH